VLPDGRFEPSRGGVPQGGPLSPLLAKFLIGNNGGGRARAAATCFGWGSRGRRFTWLAEVGKGCRLYQGESGRPSSLRYDCGG